MKKERMNKGTKGERREQGSELVEGNEGDGRRARGGGDGEEGITDAGKRGK